MSENESVEIIFEIVGSDIMPENLTKGQSIEASRRTPHAASCTVGISHHAPSTQPTVLFLNTSPDVEGYEEDRHEKHKEKTQGLGMELSGRQLALHVKGPVFNPQHKGCR